MRQFDIPVNYQMTTCISVMAENVAQALEIAENIFYGNLDDMNDRYLGGAYVEDSFSVEQSFLDEIARRKRRVVI